MGVWLQPDTRSPAGNPLQGAPQRAVVRVASRDDDLDTDVDQFDVASASFERRVAEHSQEKALTATEPLGVAVGDAGVGAPTPVARVRTQPRGDGVEDDVEACPQEPAVVADPPRPEAMPEQVPVPFMTHVEPARVAALKAFHAEPEVRLLGLHDDVEMRVHQATRDRRPPELSGDPLESVDERDSVAIVSDDAAPSVSLRDGMVHRTGAFLARQPRHVGRMCVVRSDYKLAAWGRAKEQVSG